MPNTLHLKVMGVSLDDYNKLSLEKKAEFQKEAGQKLAELHESDIDAYCDLTSTEEETEEKEGGRKPRKKKEARDEETENA